VEENVKLVHRPRNTGPSRSSVHSYVAFAFTTKHHHSLQRIH